MREYESEEDDQSSGGSIVESHNPENLLHKMNIIKNFDISMQRRETMRKKHVRRCAKELKKNFTCLYNCGKEYATDAARNMHMREKHNEVTKTERDRKARDIIRNCGLKSSSDIVSKLSQLTKI